MKKILSLLALMMLTMTSAWAGEATFDLSKSPGTSTPSDFFTHEAASEAKKWNWNTKFNGAEYDGISFSQGLKMEGATAIDFTTTAVSKVTIVQSTWSTHTIKFDGTELAVDDATAGTGCRIYTIENVEAGDHVISRGSGESGLFYVKVEWSDEVIITNKNIILNATDWGASDARYAVYAFNSDEDNTWINFLPTAQNGYYATQVGDNYAKIILVRMNGTTTENNWDNKWNQTADIDFTAIADGTIFTVKFEGDNSVYTTSNPLAEAREQLSKVIALAEMLKSADLAGAIATAQTFLTSTDVTAIAGAMQNLLNDVKPVAAQKLSDLKDMATKYGYNDLAAEIDNVATAISADTPDIDAITNQLGELVVNGKAAAAEIMDKVAGFAADLNDENLNAAIATATATVTSQTSTISDMASAVDDAVNAFKTAAGTFVQKVAFEVESEEISDADVQAKLAAIVALGENASLAAYGEAFVELVKAYQAYQLEQNPVYNVAGTADLTGYEWDVTKNQMTLNAETGLYEWTSKKIVVNAEQQPEFKVVRNYKEWYPVGNNNNWVITPNYLDGDGIYTITITFNADSKEIGVTGVKRESPAFAENNVYYWESPDGYQDQNGGVAEYVNGSGESRVNYLNADYYTICLNGKKGNLSDETPSTNAGRIVITLDQPLEVGDVIDMTAYINKNESKTASAYFVFENGTTMEGEVYSDNDNIDAAFGGSPRTTTYTVPADAAGSKTITLTRSAAGTNLFITKIEITRPIEYYLVGNFNMDGENNWVVGDANYKLAKNEEAATEEYFITVDLPANTELKVWKNTDKWFPADNFKINDAGTYTIYFRPNADGGDDWYEKCIYAVSHALTLNEEDDNTNILDEWNGKIADVTLTRTLQTGSWNTFSVPFDLDTPTGWTVKELESSSVAGTTVTLNFKDAASIEAGKPYLVKVVGEIVNPTFYGVTMSNAVDPTQTGYVDFIPTFGKTTITGSDPNTVLFIGANNYVYNPTSLPSDMKGFRGYFLLTGANEARSFVLDFGDGETTGIIEIGTMKNVDNKAIFDLQGRRVNSAAQKGVYIMNGKKTVIK